MMYKVGQQFINRYSVDGKICGDVIVTVVVSTKEYYELCCSYENHQNYNKTLTFHYFDLEKNNWKAYTSNHLDEELFEI